MLPDWWDKRICNLPINLHNVYFMKIFTHIGYVCSCSNQTGWRKANLASKLSLDNVEKQALLNGAGGGVRQR